jgi:hypothetical protein
MLVLAYSLGLDSTKNNFWFLVQLMHNLPLGTQQDIQKPPPPEFPVVHITQQVLLPP